MTTPSTVPDAQLALARDAVRRRAWDEALAAYAQADAATGLPGTELRTYATAAYLLGNVDTAVDVLVRGFEAARTADDTTEALRCGFWIIFVSLSRGDVAQAGGWTARCGRLVEHLDDDRPERAYLQVVAAFRLAAIERAYGDAQQLADRVVAVGRQARDDDLVALGLNIGGRAAIGAGRADDGLARLDEAMTAVVSGALSPPVAGIVYCSLIEACEQIGAVRRAREWTSALTRWCERQRGMVTFTGQCLTHRATILARSGDLGAAAQEAERACDRFADAADEGAVGMAHYQLGEVHRLRGDLRAAEDAYQRAAQRGHDPQPGLALVRLAQGRADDAITTLCRLLDERRDPVERVALLPALVEVQLAAGATRDASASAAELAGHAAAFGTGALGAHADRSVGAVRLAEGDASGAARLLRRAAAAWEALGVPYELARTRALVARACQALGDNDTAELEREAARRLLTRLGAVTDVVGRPGHEDRLTARERQVLGLVATGMTNKSIADRLHLSVRTVDRHVANMLAKLGAASRTEATAYAYEHGLVARGRRDP
ncbi:MAG TPA: LuxR C-terminal-related transcriptional regulator [Euzebyales bacterium]